MKKPDLNKVGGQIKHYRGEKGLKQMELSKACGYSYNIAVLWEANREAVTEEQLARIAEVLGKNKALFNGSREILAKPNRKPGAKRIRPEVNQRLDRLREESGLNFVEMAERLRMSPQHYYRILKDLANPTIDQLIAAAEHFGVTLDWLMMGKKDTAQLREMEKVNLEQKQRIADLEMKVFMMQEHQQLSQGEGVKV